MPTQSTYTAVALPSDGTTIDAADVTTDLTGFINEYNLNVGNSKIDAAAAISWSKLEAAAWTTWAPTYSASGAMTYTTVTTNRAKYIQLGKVVFYQIDASGTVGGTPGTALGFTLPVTAASTFGIAGTGLVIDAATAAAFCYFQSTTLGFIQKYDASNYTAGAARSLRIFGTYEAA